MTKPAIHKSTREYISSPRVAQGYDCFFAGSNLFALDTIMLERWFDRPGRLLDLGCGTGRHIIQFAQSGFDVVGVDLSDHMLKEVKQKLLQNNLQATLIQTNLCDLPITTDPMQNTLQPYSFDYALCMFSTLGLIHGHENRLAFLRSVNKLLRPGGQFALHVHNKGFSIWNHEGRMFLITNFIKSRLGLAEPGDKFLGYYRGIRKMFIHVFTEKEITTLLHQAGFHIKNLIPLNHRRDDILESNFLRPLRANGFLIRVCT